MFREVRHAIRAYTCRRAILVGHNAAFDLAFINAAVARAEVKRNPFHPFSCFDTATLAGAAFGQTVLAKAITVAGLPWDAGSAHNACYDAERSADIFCLVCNRLRDSHQAADELSLFPDLGGKQQSHQYSLSLGYSLGKGRITTNPGLSWNRSHSQLNHASHNLLVHLELCIDP